MTSKLMILRIMELVIPKSYFTEMRPRQRVSVNKIANGFEALNEKRISMIFIKSQMTYY